jgi:hypothetical protein
MRTAIANELKDIDDFGERCYQAYLAPADTTCPYCTFKITTDNPSYNNKCGAIGGVQVFIYAEPASFTQLDTLAVAVREQLNRVQLATSDSPVRYFVLEYVQTTDDFINENGKLSRRVDFIYPLAR